MVKLARRVRMRVPAAGAVLLLAAGTIAGCGGSGPTGSGGAGSTGSGGAGSTGSGGAGSTGSGGSGSPGSGSSTTAPTSTHPAPSRTGSLTLTPADPTTHSEITFTFTARAASGVHGKHEISYSLSVLGPDLTGCVGTHETGSPSVARGAQGQIVLGPSELRAPWCAGRYSARLLELSSAHCTGSAPCPQYVRVVGLVGRATFTVRRG